MKIAVIGTGYVGLVTGTCFAEFGFEVSCIDKDAAKIALLKKGVSPIFEVGLEALLAQNIKTKRLSFTTSITEGIKDAEIIFIAVGTPACEQSGRANLSYVFEVARELAPHLKGYAVIATKSTVPIGTSRQVAELIHQVNSTADFDMVANPEFLREGSAVEDFMRPHRIIVGCESRRARDLVQALYAPLDVLETPILYTSLETAEMIKYASNAFLATKIAFINEIADLCEQTGANVQEVATGMGLDHRIGHQFLQAGPGYGGSCFPKDTKALTLTARDFQTPLTILESVIDANDRRKKQIANKIISVCGGDVRDQKIAVLGLTFKPNTDDLRESPSLDIIPALQQAGAQLAVFDPKGMREAQRLLNEIEWTDNAYETMKNADALVIITEWSEFRTLDLKRVKSLLRTPIIIDLRNIYTPQQAEQHGLDYYSIGRRPSILTAQKDSWRKCA